MPALPHGQDTSNGGLEGMSSSTTWPCKIYKRFGGHGNYSTWPHAQLYHMAMQDTWRIAGHVLDPMED